MTKKETVVSIFEDMGYKTEVDNDGDIMVRYQMKSIYTIIGNEDEKYLVMVLPQFADVEEEELALAFAACNKATREIKLAKYYIECTLKSVSAACEFYYTDEESLKFNIEQSLRILGMTRSVFRNTKAELAE